MMCAAQNRPQKNKITMRDCKYYALVDLQLVLVKPNKEAHSLKTYFGKIKSSGFFFNYLLKVYQML